MTTQAPGIWVSDPQAYIKKLEGLLGDQEPIEVLRKTPARLERIVDKHASRVLRTRPFEGKWTPNEIVGHMVDTEWVYGFRIRLILCEDHPTILGMDQDRWVAGQHYNERKPKKLLEMFESLRRCNLSFWKALSPADLQRTGQHNERGPESLGVMLRMIAGHDLSHLDQISRYLDAIKGASKAQAGSNGKNGRAKKSDRKR